MRRLLDAFAVALSSLAEHKLRTTLTMLGMMFGVGAVIAMLSIGAGAEREALALIERLGTRNVVIRAKTFKPEELAEIRKKSLGLSLRDVDALTEAVPGVAFVAPRMEIEPYKILAGGAKTEAAVFGVGYRHDEVSPFSLEEGRLIDKGDEDHHAQVAVIGAGARRDLFGADAALGKDVKINDVWFEVIGVLAADPSAVTAVQGVSVVSTDHEIYIPFTTALRKLDRDPMKSPLGQIVVRLAKDAPAGETGAVIGTLLDRLHGGARDYEIVVPEALLKHSRETQRLFNLVMGLIAGISLLVGGIGIMNIMLASVLERTREIGVRRAVGATRADIRFQFLVTAFSLAMMGGVLGVTMGVAHRARVAAYADWPTVVTTWSIALSLGVSVFVGVASGLYPAMRAARLDPIQALNGLVSRSRIPRRSSGCSTPSRRSRLNEPSTPRTRGPVEDEVERHAVVDRIGRPHRHAGGAVERDAQRRCTTKRAAGERGCDRVAGDLDRDRRSSASGVVWLLGRPSRWPGRGRHPRLRRADRTATPGGRRSRRETFTPRGSTSVSSSIGRNDIAGVAEPPPRSSCRQLERSTAWPSADAPHEVHERRIERRATSACGDRPRGVDRDHAVAARRCPVRSARHDRRAAVDQSWLPTSGGRAPNRRPRPLVMSP